MRALVGNGTLSMQSTRIMRETERTPEISDDFRNAWTKKDARAMFIVSSSMEYSQLEYLITCTTAAEMWTKLFTSAIHKSRNAHPIDWRLQNFTNTALRPAILLLNILPKLKTWQIKLLNIDENVSDIMIMVKILGTLSLKYNALISTWDSINVAEQTLPRLRERLIREETRITSMDEQRPSYNQHLTE